MEKLFLIPALNPDKSLTELINQIINKFEVLNDKKNQYLILIINDGSYSESSIKILKDINLINNVHVINNSNNLGKGAALKIGIKFAKDNNFKYVITADADGQHLSDDIIKVSKAVEEKSDFFVLGIREFDEKVPLRSKIGNVLTRFIFNIILRKRIFDTQTGLRAFSEKYYELLISLPEKKYDFELSSLIAVARIGDFYQIPIKTIYEPGNPTSFFRPFKDSSIIYFVFIRYLGIVPLLVILEVFLITIFNNIIGYSIAFLIARLLSLIIYFLSMKQLVFRVEGSIKKQSGYFIILATFNILIFEVFLINLSITSNLLFIFYYMFIHSFLLLLNFYIQNKFIFKD